MITIIIVDYFSRPCLDRLMASLEQYEPDVPVLVSSNSRYDRRTWTSLQREFPRAAFISNERNLGYAGGVNRALEKVATPYAVILNPDVEICHGLVDTTHQLFQTDRHLALFGPMVLDGFGKPTYSFRRFYSPAYILGRYLLKGCTAASRHISQFYLMDDVSRERFTYVDWVSGGAMFVRMDAVHQAGGMDERYFLYMEDLDWCRMFWHKGWRVAYSPQIILHHPARHEGTRLGLHGLLTKATRCQLASYGKYLTKWGLAAYSPADWMCCHH